MELIQCLGKILTLPGLVPCWIAAKEAHQKWYIQKCWHHAIQLIRQPEIGKVHKAKGGHDDATENTQRPVACLVMKCPCWI